MKIIAKLAVIALRIIYFLFKLFLRPRKKIVFLSRQGDAPPEDFALLEKAIKKADNSIKTKMLTKKIPPGLIGKISYGFHLISQMYNIATSKVIIIDGYSIAVSVLKHKNNQKVIQLWHALNIVKKFGYGTLGKPWGRSEEISKIMCMHRNYDYIVACSEKSAVVLAECFNVSLDKTVLLPLPRIDYILKSRCKKEEIKNKYPQIFQKPILVYAPTFRGETVDLSWIEKTVDLEKYNVVVKLHPADTNGLAADVNNAVICDSCFTSFEWMKVCDSLITDYSGMGFEAMLLRKKVYYYLYDYEDYSEKNGLAIDLFSEAIAPYVTKTETELKILLKKEYDFNLTKLYTEKYLSVGTKNCTNRLAKFVIDLF